MLSLRRLAASSSNAPMTRPNVANGPRKAASKAPAAAAGVDTFRSMRSLVAANSSARACASGVVRMSMSSLARYTGSFDEGMYSIMTRSMADEKACEFDLLIGFFHSATIRSVARRSVSAHASSSIAIPFSAMSMDHVMPENAMSPNACCTWSENITAPTLSSASFFTPRITFWRGLISENEQRTIGRGSAQPCRKKTAALWADRGPPAPDSACGRAPQRWPSAP
mmetsp:Transcript_30305/g.87928  ORF Transcript_30305/g.87928 Transcript_30305/m.87928 type:complete len:225 (+) Transcript_30305:1310-1984(+)